MRTQAWVQRIDYSGRNYPQGHFETIDIPDSAIRGAVPQQQPIKINTPRESNGHPLLIAGIVVGLLLGLLAVLPPKARGFAVLALIAGVIWFVWAASRDQKMVGTADPAPRAELVRLPDYAPRAELVKLPAK